MRITKNPMFCSTSSRRDIPTELKRTNVFDSETNIPVTSKDVLGIVGFFAVLIVVQSELALHSEVSYTCSSCSLSRFASTKPCRLSSGP